MANLPSHIEDHERTFDHFNLDFFKIFIFYFFIFGFSRLINEWGLT